MGSGSCQPKRERSMGTEFQWSPPAFLTWSSSFRSTSSRNRYPQCHKEWSSSAKLWLRLCASLSRKQKSAPQSLPSLPGYLLKSGTGRWQTDRQWDKLFLYFSWTHRGIYSYSSSYCRQGTWSPLVLAPGHRVQTQNHPVAACQTGVSSSLFALDSLASLARLLDH